ILRPCGVSTQSDSSFWADVVGRESESFLINGRFMSTVAVPCPLCGVLLRSQHRDCYKKYANPGRWLGVLLLLLAAGLAVQLAGTTTISPSLPALLPLGIVLA